MRGTQLLLLVWILSAWNAAAQGRISFEAHTDAREIFVGGYVNISFTLKNANGDNFQPPSFRNFKILSGPNRSVSTTIVNGVRSQEQTIAYTLLATQTGEFTINSARIQAGNRTLKTAPITIRVVEKNAAAEIGGSAEAPIFLRAILSDSSAWVGQQVLLDYKIYTTKDIDSYNLLAESDYEGIYQQEMRGYNPLAHREIINGQEYTTKILKRIALFPQQAGVFTVKPMSLQIGVVRENEHRRRGFFFFRDVTYENVTSLPVDLQVRSLPGDMPQDYSGVAGEYTMVVRSGKSHITTDDAFSFQIKITGNGDPKRLLAPEVQFPDGFQVYDPTVVAEDEYENNGAWLHSKTFGYNAVPLSAGQYQIVPRFNYFSPADSTFKTLAPDTLTISVAQGKHPSGQRQFLKTDEDTPAATLRDIKRRADLQRENAKFLKTPLFWILLLLPIFVLSAGGIYRVRQQREAALDSSQRKWKGAGIVARRRLERARQLMEAKRKKEFFDEVSKALFGYVSDKTRLAYAEISKEKVRIALAKYDTPGPLITRFISVIQTCEMILFAGQYQRADMQQTYREAAETIDALEAIFKKFKN